MQRLSLVCVVRCDSYRSAIAVIAVVHARVRHTCARKECALLDRLLSVFGHDYRQVRVVLLGRIHSYIRRILDNMCKQ